MGGNIGEIQLGSKRELYKYINHYAVVIKASSKIMLSFFFAYISLTADGAQRARLPVPPIATLPSCLWSRRIFPSLPGSSLAIFFRDASSTLLQLVNQWLNVTYSRSHTFRYEARIQILVLTRIELTTFALLILRLHYVQMFPDLRFFAFLYSKMLTVAKIK